ncbi:DUF6559 family protein [Photobacterium kasasachensis]|uniref:DUF6559 family protein n=1 Tax=Photobacterium kasasachensis TaxID=2910240 RepID=UPI003D0A0644
MFQNYLKKRKIKRYARKIPRDLKANYGYQNYFTKEQVDAAITRQKIGNSNAPAIIDNSYAYAMYCSPEEFSKIYENIDGDFDYETIREEVSDVIFYGISGFSFSSLLVVSLHSGFSPEGSDDGDSDGGSDGGGDGGD